MTLVLADTSVWIEHLRSRDPVLEELLVQRRIRMHPFVMGELAMGNLADRAKTLRQLGDIHRSRRATDEEVMALVEGHRHYGGGLSWVDGHLLSAVILTEAMTLWTRDRRLNEAAARHGRAANLLH